MEHVGLCGPTKKCRVARPSGREKDHKKCSRSKTEDEGKQTVIS